MDFKIQTLPQVRMDVVQPTQPYQVTYYRDAVDVDGNTIKVEDRKDIVTIDQLSSQKMVLQAKIDEIDAQIKQIGELK